MKTGEGVGKILLGNIRKLIKPELKMVKSDIQALHFAWKLGLGGASLGGVLGKVREVGYFLE